MRFVQRSSRAICGLRGNDAFSVFMAASRLCNAWLGVSPDKMRLEDCTGAGSGTSRGADGSGMTMLSTAAVGIARGASVLAFRRFAFLLPSSRRNQRRIVSRPIPIPISRRPAASVSAESPAWASRSNSSRCGSNWAVAWLRGCRAWATAWASVVGRGAVRGEWMGSDMVVNGSLYAWCLGRARGVPRAQSKRKRLDVGILPHCFVLFLLGESGYHLSLFIGSFIRLVDFLDFVFGVLVELASLSFWFHRFDVHFPDRVGPSLVAGGSGC